METEFEKMCENYIKKTDVQSLSLNKLMFGFESIAKGCFDINELDDKIKLKEIMERIFLIKKDYAGIKFKFITPSGKNIDNTQYLLNLFKDDLVCGEKNALYWYNKKIKKNN